MRASPDQRPPKLGGLRPGQGWGLGGGVRKPQLLHFLFEMSTFTPDEADQSLWNFLFLSAHLFHQFLCFVDVFFLCAFFGEAHVMLHILVFAWLWTVCVCVTVDVNTLFSYSLKVICSDFIIHDIKQHLTDLITFVLILHSIFSMTPFGVQIFIFSKFFWSLFSSLLFKINNFDDVTKTTFVKH